MPLTAAGRDAILNNGAQAITHLGALVDLAPAEPSGGTGATYARQAITFAAASGGIRDNNAQIVIPIPGGLSGPIIAISAYSALTGGTMYAYGGIGSSLLKGVATVVSVAGNVLSSNGNSLANGDRVMIFPVAGESLPAPLSATTLYHVVTAATDSFQVSLTNGGAAVDITTLGELGWAKTVPETFASAGNLTIATGAYDLDMNFG
jgi:hypothetical protein